MQTLVFACGRIRSRDLKQALDERGTQRDREEIHTYLNGTGELQVLAAVADLHHGRVFAGLAGRYPTTFGKRFLGVDVHGIDHHPPTHVHLLRLLSLPPCTPLLLLLLLLTRTEQNRA
jgi:hypothetical protein